MVIAGRVKSELTGMLSPLSSAWLPLEREAGGLAKGQRSLTVLAPSTALT